MFGSGVASRSQSSQADSGCDGVFAMDEEMPRTFRSKDKEERLKQGRRGSENQRPRPEGIRAKKTWESDDLGKGKFDIRG